MQEDAIKPTEQEQVPDGCASCGTRYYLKDYPTKLCSECREQFIKFPIPKWLWLFAGAIGLVILFSIYKLPENISLGIAYEKGIKAEKNHQYVTAQREFAKLAEKVPNYIEGQGHLMIAAFHNGDLDAYNKALVKLNNKQIEDKELLDELNEIVDRSVIYVATDSFNQLTDKYDSMSVDIRHSAIVNYIKSHSTEMYPRIWYTSLLMDENNYRACQQYLEEVLEFDRNCIPVLMRMASVHREMGNYDSSIYFCERILVLNKEANYAKASKARTYLKMKKDKEALKLAEEACKQNNEKDGYSLATLALAYHFNNEIEKRDAVINENKNDTALKYYMQIAVDIINKKESFRD